MDEEALINEPDLDYSFNLEEIEDENEIEEEELEEEPEDPEEEIEEEELEEVSDFDDATPNIREGLDLYLSQIGKVPLIDHDREIALAKQIEKGDQEAKRELVEANLRWVVKVAMRYSNTHLKLPDLIQEGNIGLIHAAEKYDWQKGYKFCTYATGWIRQAITRAIAKKGKTIRTPVYVSEALRGLNSVIQEFDDSHDREPNLDELFALTQSDEKLKKLTRETIEHIFRVRRQGRLLSLEEKILPEVTISETITDPEEETPEEIVNKRDISDCLEEILDCLLPNEGFVLRKRSGLDDGIPRTLEEIGHDLHVTRERVRQIEVKAKRRIRNLGKGIQLRQLAGYEE